MGPGTGLNAFLTAIEAQKQERKIRYIAVERLPINPPEVTSLQLSGSFRTCRFISEDTRQSMEWWLSMNTLRWKRRALIFSTSAPLNLVYYDAFAPKAQPELWTKEVFKKLFFMLDPGRVLVTYCSKGDVRRALTHQDSA
jgi:tRNA U34 5-methylaminomethyl-2-thiouridine-forming methyltransferase MnmC